MKRKRYTDHLRTRLEETVEMGILDPLTALHNRRYMTSHLKMLFEGSSQRGKPLLVLLLDIHYFKAVDDSYGHDAGDSVLREFASRVRRNIRGIDLACRLGGRGVRGGHVGHGPRQGLSSLALAPMHRRGSVICRGEDRGARDDGERGRRGARVPDDTPKLILKRADQASAAPSVTATGLWPTPRRT